MVSWLALGWLQCGFGAVDIVAEMFGESLEICLSLVAPSVVGSIDVVREKGRLEGGRVRRV